MTVVRARRVRVPLLALFAALTSASPAAPGTAAPTATELVQRLQAAWDNRDLAAYLGLWRFAGEDAHRTEREWAEPRLVGEEAQLILDPAAREAAARLEVTGAAVSVTEPRGRVDQVRWVLERGADGWAITRRDGLSQIDGLVHLSLDPTGYRAAGMTLKLPDFELKMTRGTLFTSPRSVGPTVLVFVGEGTVRVTPAPETEQQQLRQFAGRPHLDEKVRVALARIHPAELHRVLSPVRFEPGPEAERHRPMAQRFFREHVDDAFVLDAALPRSPWWLLPSLGDALVVFDSRKGTLSFAVSRSEREAISLFDRERQRQINLYALPGDDRPYDEDAGRSLDVLHQDLTVRFDPDRLGLAGEVRLRLRILQASSTIRLRLADPLKVVSLRSEEGGNHLFFRVRHQDTLMVSLGALAGTTGDVTFVVTFSGSLTPLRVEREVVQLTAPDVGEMETDSIPVEQALVYGNQTPWYPQGPPDDYATAVVRTDTPEGYLGVTGGRQVSLRTVDGRTRAEYRLEQPGKYVTVAVGRLASAGAQEMSGVRVEAYAVPRLRRMAQARINDAMAILRFYTEEFGPAPYPDLNLVLTESRVPGGHSPPGMVVVALRPMLLKGSLRDDPASFPDIPDYFLAHELAHQWWGHGVSGQNYRERWISEGFAQYASALWVRHRRGEAVFRSMLSRFARWGLRYANEGPIHLGHRLGHIKNDPQIFRAVVYDKAAYVLHMLRQIVGDETFRRALMQLQTEARFTKIGTEDIRMSMEAASGRDLREYFAAWIYGTRLPRLEMTHKSERAEGGWKTEVRVRGEHLPGPLPLELAIAHAGGTELRKVELGIDGGSWTVETPGPPRKVEVNRDRGLLATVRSGRS